MSETTLSAAPDWQGAQPRRDFNAFVTEGEAGLHRLDLLVEGLHCGGCVHRIERALGRRPEVAEARVNLTNRRLSLGWRGPAALADDLIAAVETLGYRVAPFNVEAMGSDEGRCQSELLKCMAVAGFAAGNVMLLSIAVWAGYGEGMGAATRGLLHWFSALIALPAAVYAGRPFYRSALAALKARRANMDVPISLALLLAAAMSLHETAVGGRYVYFDSVLALLFFLLVGRYLEQRARGRARAAAGRLLALAATAATVLRADGGHEVLALERVRPGMRILTAAGERIAADARVLEGTSELDNSLITGESLPAAVAPGERVFAGTLNLAAALTLEVTAVGPDTLLAEIVRLMEQAEQRRARGVVLADRIARVYAPAVHGLALATFLGWLLAGVAWQTALLHAVAVLIITCPCALALAVPVVQVIASGRLMRRGVLVKSGSALERLSQVERVVIDKTGTLTRGQPRLLPEGQDPESLQLAAGLAAASRHPLARALAEAVPVVAPKPGVREVPGCGLVLETTAGEVRLGSARWCGAGSADHAPGPELWLAQPGRQPLRFAFADPLRDDAGAVVTALKARGLAVEILSGDRSETVAAVAAELGIETWQAGCSPADKVAHLERLSAAGETVLMAGDGLNDAPALAAASVSLSPSSAIDISQTAADVVFQGQRLAPVLACLEVAQRTRTLVRQNFALAFGYNLLAVPLAVLGLVTPLLAALSMSASSLLVIVNALRLNRGASRSPPS